MRIVLVGTGVRRVPPAGYGGVERVLGELAEALRRARHEVSIVQEVRSERPIDEYRFALHLKKMLLREQYDVLHASTPVIAGRLALARLRYVYTTHSRHWFERSRITERWGYWLETRAVRRSAATIALTERLKNRIVAALSPKLHTQLAVIPIGVDTAKFQPDWTQRNGHRALGVGAIIPAKRWELAARGLRGTGFSLRIAGPIQDPNYATTVREAGDRVELLGEIPEHQLLQEYAQSDVLVHPSRVELLPGAVVQGLAAGLPVLGAEPVVDLIVPGETGWTAPENGDPTTIVRFLHDQAVLLASDPSRLRMMGEAARRSAAERFNWDQIAAAHVELYAQTLSEAGSSPA